MFAVLLATSIIGSGGCAGNVVSHGCFDGYGCYGAYGHFGSYGAYGHYGSYGAYGHYAPYGYYGCYGCCGCHGCYEPYVSFLGHGCYGCYSCHACYGYIGCHACYGCYGCFGQAWSFATPDCYTLVPVIPGCSGESDGPNCAPNTEKSTSYHPNPTKSQELRSNAEKRIQTAGSTTSLQSSQSELGRRALIRVILPAQAKLYLDGNPTNSQGKSARSIITPDLEAGSRYFYVLSVEFTAGSHTHVETKRVSFQAGQTVGVEFSKLIELHRNSIFVKNAN